VIICELCQKKLRTRNVNYHNKTFHPEKHAQEMEKAAEEERNRVTETFTCDVCNNGKSYSSKKSLLEHRGLHDGSILKVSCPKCGLKLRSNQKLRLHDLREHSDAPRLPTPRKPLKRRTASPSDEPPTEDEKPICTICNNGKVYASTRTLREHQLIHSQAHLKVACEICGHRVKRLSHLRTHMKTAHPPKIRDDYWVPKQKRNRRIPVLSDSSIGVSPEDQSTSTASLKLLKTEDPSEEDEYALGLGNYQDTFIKFRRSDEIETRKRLQIRLTRIQLQ